MYSSLQPKALETALLATENLGIPIKTEDKLTETTSFTNTFGSLDMLEENSKIYYANENTRINNGETMKEAVLRFTSALEDIVAKEKDKKYIGIVSHGSILASFAAGYTKENAYTLVERMRQPDIAVFQWETKKFSLPFGEIKIEL